MYINGRSLSEFGGELLASWKADATPFTQAYYKSRSGTSFTPLGSVIGLKTITLPFDISGQDSRDVARKESVLKALATSGKVELYLPDGFYYTALFQSSSMNGWVLPTMASYEYIFVGIQHDAEVVLRTSGQMFCGSTLPYTDCVIETVASITTASYSIAGITFDNILAGDRIVIDGWTKRVLINGASAAERCDITKWPRLVPGENTFNGLDEMVIRYFPSYI